MRRLVRRRLDFLLIVRVLLVFLPPLLLVPPPRCNIPGNENEEGDGSDDAL